MNHKLKVVAAACPLLRSMQSRRSWGLHHCQGTERSRYRAKRLVRFGEGGWQVRCFNKNLSCKRGAYARAFSIMKALFFSWLFVCFSKNRRNSYFCALPCGKADPISTARCARSVTSLPIWIAKNSVKLECCWRLINGQSGREPFIRLCLCYWWCLFHIDVHASCSILVFVMRLYSLFCVIVLLCSFDRINFRKLHFYTAVGHHES